jgi:hypothetical protein
LRGNLKPRHESGAAGFEFRQAGGWPPSSRARSACGAEKDGSPLPERTHACGCGNALDGGAAAAAAVKNEALRMLQAA